MLDGNHFFCRDLSPAGILPYFGRPCANAAEHASMYRVLLRWRVPR
jgi:hypothetical protein